MDEHKNCSRMIDYHEIIECIVSALDAILSAGWSIVRDVDLFLFAFAHMIEIINVRRMQIGL